ncbi:hypothetical protein LCGC14_0384310 [marine sediment metagenome]|uniref:Uncharacterized protein n=1 Tax=marine sediment metagenome TaxID=412755 RepID=A0A0F9TJH5_9ZZZZ
MIACDPYLLEFLRGNIITMNVIVAGMGAFLKAWATISKNNGSNKVQDFLTSLVESGKTALVNRRERKNGGKNAKPDKASGHSLGTGHSG